ncbi:DUF1376 domain-containing protein [Acetobacter vaccinii]|uniref:DUF1376 domain-containing protein n=1 Tax=Acetobacter vaccinii TaxID=2592655 RepID=UPI001AEF4278|nr:DUF1376 domain-containing protein [Acetobacter vaccinii]
MTDTPPPLTPPDSDLRGLPFMPLDTVRLLDSDLFALSTGEEFKAAVALWCKAWQQVPAASLPGHDRVLAHLSGAGVDWPAVRAMALHGWQGCADGRLYHPVLAEKANHAWQARLAQRARAARRWHGHTPAQARADATEHAVADARERGRESTSLRSGTARGQRLPTDWQPDATQCAFAQALGLDPAAQAERFCDYWRGVPGQRGCKADWAATWRNWCRREATGQRPAASPHPLEEQAERLRHRLTGHRA